MNRTNPAIPVFARRAAVIVAVVIAAILLFSILAWTQEQTTPQRPAWDVQLAPNTHASSTITIRNLCQKSHSFTITEQETPYLTLGRGTTNVRGHSSYELPVRFNTDGMKPGTYQGSVIVKCENCAKEKGCQQDRDIIPLHLVIGANAANQNNPPQDQVPGAPPAPDKTPTGPIADGPSGPVSQPTPTPAPTPTDTVSSEFCKEKVYKNYRADIFDRVDSSDSKRLKVRSQSGAGGSVVVYYHCVDATNKTHSTTFTVKKSDGTKDIVQVDCGP
jgi:hypothetical protein